MINYKKKNFWNQNEMSNGRQPYPDDWWDADHLLFYKKNNFWENYPKFESPSSQVPQIPRGIDGVDFSVHRVSQISKKFVLPYFFKLPFKRRKKM